MPASGLSPRDHRAEFLVQLIAAREGLPQARGRRRAEPSEAVAAYGRAGARAVPPARGTVWA